MRISTLQAFNNGVSGLQRNYSDVTRTQEQISTGKRLLTPADDPVASVRLLQLGQEEAMNAQYKTGITAAKNSLTAEETVLTSVGNVMQRIRELAVQAGNGALDASDKDAIATELAQRETELLNLMNSRDASGKYLFAGSMADTQPFVRNEDGTYTYKGDESQRQVQIASSTYLALNDNGKALFDNMFDANRVTTSKVPGLTDTGSRISLGLVQNTAEYDQEFPHFELPVDGVTISVAADGTYQVFDSAGDLIPSDSEEDRTLKDDAVMFGGVRVEVAGTGSFKLQPDPQNHDKATAVGDLSTTVSPEKPGIGIKFLSEKDYVLYDLSKPPTDEEFDALTLPLTAKPEWALGTGKFDENSQTPDFILHAGVKLQIDGTPEAGDSFEVHKNTTQEKTSLLNVVSDLRKALETAEDTPEGSLKIRDATAVAIANLDTANAQVLSVQGKIGARLNVIESTETFVTDVSLVNKSVQSELEDLDYAEALSRLSMQSTILQAAQQSYVKISSLNLFSFLN
ncbi:flagellar hook-associated protein FlgL [Stutzerimonas urumqiensis]|uniref:flagellar hook-associated protein FlgL n=1 Tax=Stutzerimonas urumqiensis TaxID=638269 RepID=UPI001FE3416A|nr:flagellar hook-associated protein FlgL [Stutzerimonas urumqiensis]